MLALDLALWLGLALALAHGLVLTTLIRVVTSPS